MEIIKKKKIRKYCIAFGCINNDRAPKISFFTLPKDVERRRKWLQSIDRKDLINKDDLKVKSYVVCSAHFDSSAISVVTKLNNDAVPTKFLPIQEEEDYTIRLEDIRSSNTSSRTKTTNEKTTVSIETQTEEIALAHQNVVIEDEDNNPQIHRLAKKQKDTENLEAKMATPNVRL